MAGINIYNDPLLGNSQNYSQNAIEAQKRYLAELESLQNRANQPLQQGNGSSTPIWDKIDSEVATLTDMQKQALFNSEEYVEANNNVQAILQSIFLSIIKPQVENSEEGKKALEQQYDLVKKLKKTVVEDTNKEMEQFRRWQEFAAKNPKATYQDFLTSLKK